MTMNALTEHRFLSDHRPLPLRRAMPPGRPFPLDALGPLLGEAAHAIIDIVQVPDAIAGQSVLGVSSLSVQAQADVVIPATGDAKPISLFMVTVAGSGDRKSAADSKALDPVRLRERQLQEAYEAERPQYLNALAAYDKAREIILKKMKDGERGETQAKLDAIGQAPQPPMVPMLTCVEPTLAGLHKLLLVGEPSIGLFSDEGGNFLGGHSMRDENRLHMATGLTGLWDGSPISRVRAEDGAAMMRGRRFSMHLMVQPMVAEQLLADPLLKEQGLLSRILVASPPSLVGTRFQRPSAPGSAGALLTYRNHISRLLALPQPRPDPSRNELDPRPLELDGGAKALWSEFADEVERRIAQGAEWEPIRGFANKLPEHAARIGAVLQLVEAIDAPLLSEDVMSRGITLARYYASEALRLFDAGSVGVDIQHAERLLEWLHQKRHEQVGLKTIYQLGPNVLRHAKKARETVAILVDHGWLAPIVGGAVIDGERHRDAWLVRSAGCTEG